jgi:hypothetical protein
VLAHNLFILMIIHIIIPCRRASTLFVHSTWDCSVTAISSLNDHVGCQHKLDVNVRSPFVFTLLPERLSFHFVYNLSVVYINVTNPFKKDLKQYNYTSMSFLCVVYRPFSFCVTCMCHTQWKNFAVNLTCNRCLLK